MKGFKTTRRCVRHRAFVVRALSSGEKSFIIAILTLKQETVVVTSIIFYLKCLCKPPRRLEP